jgi:hypothetical protein
MARRNIKRELTDMYCALRMADNPNEYFMVDGDFVKCTADAIGGLLEIIQAQHEVIDRVSWGWKITKKQQKVLDKNNQLIEELSLIKR